MLSDRLLGHLAGMYAAGADLDFPDLSPLAADPRGLPPVIVQYGENDMLRDDTLAFAARARRAGVTVHCRSYPGMWHAFHLFTGAHKTATAALGDLVTSLENLVLRA